MINDEELSEDIDMSELAVSLIMQYHDKIKRLLRRVWSLC